MRDNPELERTIEGLLSDPAYDGHPLRRPLADLYQEFREALYQIERIARISDRYQSNARESTLSLSARYSKQLRQLEKLARISDRYQLMMRDLNEALKDASTRDTLTGIGNRRMLMDRMKAEAARAKRMNQPLTLAIADVDRFKSVNDAYGHEVGDKVLVQIARTIETNVREYDVCGRWGGEEFLIVMPEIGIDEGALVVERVRAAVHELKLDVDDGMIEVSASFGLAEHQADETVSATINRADAALFAAKRAGRNRYEVAA